ncbi:MAG: hypothetical protein AB7E80_03160 [Hyphomicrobiaceae bacterium]
MISEYLEKTVPHRLEVIYFLRDPLNCLASQAKACEAGSDRDIFRLFGQVLGFEDIVSRLSSSSENRDRMVMFSSWRYRDAYRAAVAERLGCENIAPPSKTSRFGGGSSFDGLAVNPDEAEKRLNSRWRGLISTPLFLSFFIDPRSVAAYRQYFGGLGGDGASEQDLEEVVSAAANSPEAVRIFETKLRPIRENEHLMFKLQQARTSAMREFWRARIQLATGLRFR